MRRRAGVCRIHALGQVLDGGGELSGEVAGGTQGVPLAGIEPVVAAPGAEHHGGMLKKVAVDGDLHALDGEGGGLQPGRVGVAGVLAGSALAQAQDVRDHAGAFLGEGLGGQADGAQEIRLLREMRPQAGVLLVERVVAGHQGQHATRLQGVEGLGEKEVMQGQAHPVVVQAEIGEGHVAEDGVNAVLGQAGVAEVFDADVVAGVQHAGDPSGEAVELHADEAHARRGLGHEVADAAARLQDGGLGGHAQVRRAPRAWPG